MRNRPELVDERGAVAWQQRTALCGHPLPDAVESIDCPLCFPGQFHDVETGLHSTSSGTTTRPPPTLSAPTRWASIRT
ncbi:hypothetical protein [Kitasatospora sp. NPDC015120]|uniref:hypothetical protein n=1 Tax=Kitasatospora sp. NPDC015120 TaxID=3364023 RepID=UPI0036F483A0